MSEGAVRKILTGSGDKNTDERQKVSEVKSSVPMLNLEGLQIIVVQPLPIGEKRSNGIRHRPMLFDGITPPTLETAPSLTTFDS